MTVKAKQFFVRKNLDLDCLIYAILGLISDFSLNNYSSILSDFVTLSDVAKVVIASNFSFFFFFFTLVHHNLINLKVN